MTTSLILLSLPSSSFCALDLSSFTTTDRFRGIKNITPGLHFCYFSTASPAETTSADNRITDLDAAFSSSSSLNFRTGFFFSVSERTLLIVKRWDAKTETLVDASEADITSVKNIIDEVTREYLTPYENLQQPAAKAEIWAALTASLEDGTNLARILGSRWTCESSREAAWESEELDAAIRDGPNGWTREVTEEEKSERENGLGFSKVDLKRTWPVDAVGRERTIWARDRTWALTELFNNLSTSSSSDSKTLQVPTADSETGQASVTVVGQQAVLSELVLSYILAALLANYSSTAQFKSLLELCLSSNLAIASHPAFYANLLATLQTILRATRIILGETQDSPSDDEDDNENATGFIPEDPLLEEFISGGDQLLIRLLRQFNRNFEEVLADIDVSKKTETQALKKAFDELRTYCRKSLSWYLDDSYVKKGMLQLPPEEGGGSVMVEIEDDEGEEYAPVIVEL